MTSDELNSRAQAVVLTAAKQSNLMGDIAAALHFNTHRDCDLPDERMIAVLTEALSEVLEGYYFPPG